MQAKFPEWLVGNRNLFALWLLYIIGATILFFQAPSVPLTNDSPAYLRTAAAPLESPKLWLGDKPPLAPLIFRALSNNLNAIALAQFALSLLPWGCLAYTCASLVKAGVTRYLVFAGILILSLGSDVSMWAHTVMSESVDFSVFALLLSSWLLLLDRPSRPRFLAIALFSGLWAITRDSNGFVLLIVSAIAGGTFALPRFRGRRTWYYCAAASSLLFGLFAIRCDDLSGRWQFPFYNMLSQRILPYQDRLEFFKEHGMPAPPALMELKGGWAYTNDFAYWRDPALSDFRNWANKSGRRTYAAFTLAHPQFTLKAPSDFPEAMFPSLAGYFYPKPLPPISQDRINAWVRARFGYVAAIFVLLAIGAWIAAKRTHGLRSYHALAYALIFIIVPEFMLLWIADPMDLTRHYLSMAVSFRISALLLAAVLCDSVLATAPGGAKIAGDHASSVSPAKGGVRLTAS